MTKTSNIKNVFALLLFFCAGMWMFVSCNNWDYNTTSGGLKYRIIEKKNGRKPGEGEMMRMHLKYFNSNDSVLYDSKELGDAFVLQLTAATFKGGLEEGFSMMGEGDSAIFLVSADSIFEKTFQQPLPATIRAGDWLKFHVRMMKVMSRDEFKNEIPLGKANRDSGEIGQIETYLKSNNISIAPVREGLYIVVLQEGDGIKPIAGDSVEIEYTGCFLSGEVFDASSGIGRNLKYKLGDGSKLIAWEMAVSSMKENSVFRLILSSGQAFGEQGAGPVPPNTPVIYNIKLVKVKTNRSI